MADQVSKYQIDYSAPPAKVIADLAAIDRALAHTQTGILKTAGMLKALGQNSPGVLNMIGELKKLDVELRSKVADAGKAEAALKTVGRGNTSVTSLTNRLKDLEAELAKVKTDASATASALTSVGQGVQLPGPAGGGATGGAGTGRGGLGNRLVAGLARHAAYAAFRNSYQAVGNAARGKREFFSGAADMVSDYRKDLQEVSVLEGKDSVDNDALKRDLQFQKETLTNADESRELRLEFGGAVSIPKAKGNITDEIAVGLEKEAAKFGIRYGLDMKTTGRMAGLLGNYGKINSVAHGAGIMEETAEQLNIYGVGSVKGMMPAMTELSAQMVEGDSADGVKGGGRFASQQALAARMAASTAVSGGKPSVAAKRIEQANRLMRKFNGKDEEAYLRKIGITPEDDFETAIRKFPAEITGPQGELILAQAGFKNTTETKALTVEAKMNKAVDKQLADPRMAAAKAEAVARNSAFAGSLQGQQRAAENEEFAATIGAGMAGEGLKAARTKARARMITGGQLKAGPIQGLKDTIRSTLSSAGGVSGEDLRIDEEAVEELKREGAKFGIDVAAEFPRLSPKSVPMGGTTSGTDEPAFQADFAKAQARIEAAKKNGPARPAGLQPAPAPLANRKLKIVIPPGMGDVTGDVDAVADRTIEGTTTTGDDATGQVTAPGGEPRAVAPRAGAASESGFDRQEPGPPGEGPGARAVVDATNRVAEKIDRQTDALLRAMSGGGPRRPSPPPNVGPVGNAGAGFNPGRP